MIIDTVDKLRAFARNYREKREREKIDSVLAYHRNRTQPNMVRIAHSVDLTGEERIARELLETCRPKSPCGLYGCPRCGERFKKQAKLESLKAIIAKHGRIPDSEDISFVTINGPRIPSLDPEAVEAAKKEFQKQIRRRRRNGLPTIGLHGFFDVSAMGLVHWHGPVLHPGIPRNRLRRKLQREFPGKRIVKVSEWKKDKTLWENLDAIIDYSLVAGRHTKLIKGIPKFGKESPKRIMKRIVALQYMARRGVQGLRLSLNIRTSRRWKNGILFDKTTGELSRIPEMEKLILGKGKQQRKDRNWDRAGRVALWPRRKATEQIRGVRPSVTGSPEEVLEGGSNDFGAFDLVQVEDDGIDGIVQA